MTVEHMRQLKTLLEGIEDLPDFAEVDRQKAARSHVRNLKQGRLPVSWMHLIDKSSIQIDGDWTGFKINPPHPVSLDTRIGKFAIVSIEPRIVMQWHQDMMSEETYVDVYWHANNYREQDRDLIIKTPHFVNQLKELINQMFSPCVANDLKLEEYERGDGDDSGSDGLDGAMFGSKQLSECLYKYLSANFTPELWFTFLQQLKNTA